MIELGHYCLIAAMVAALYGTVASAWGGRTANVPLVRSAENSAIAAFALLCVSAVSLWTLLLTDQFIVEYVAGYSARDIPTRFKFTAFWGGQAGSLLLWTLVLSLFSAVVVVQNRNRNRQLMPYANSVLMGILLFFVVLLNFTSSPFETLAAAPADGRGLNPILQNWYMIIHPPTLFLGYVGMAVPFAFSMAALMSGRMDTSWIRVTRRWTLIAWVFLTCGFTLGGVWAYEELGWGGYWAWDPVENASFMPWLVASAFLHSIMITEKKGMLKMWNFILILLAFELSIFGTFITRSGVVSSVHSFALSNMGPLFVIFLSTSTFFGLFWIFYRSGQLVSEQRMRSFLSREATFLLNNWLFVSICFAVFWGTIFPILSEWVQGEKISVSTPFFNRVTWPLGLGLLILTGICPLIAWRKASWKNVRRNFLFPLSAGLAAGLVLIAAGMRNGIAIAFFSSSAFVAMTIVFEFYKGARARQTIRTTSFLVALKDLTLMNKRRYGGFIIHGGVVLVFVGIIASSLFQVEGEFTVAQGERFQLGSQGLVFEELLQRRDPEKDVVFARIGLFEGDNKTGELYPEKHFHHKSEQPVTEVAIRSRLSADLYVVLAGWDQQGNATFHVFINPLVQLIWVGIAVMALGGVFVTFPDKQPAASAASQKSRSEVKDEAA